MEELKLLKYTIRGLNYRYNALKQINALLGESKNLKNFLDNVLGIIMEINGAEAGVVLIDKDFIDIDVQVFRAEIPFEKEQKSKEEIEELEIKFKEIGFDDILEEKKELEIINNPQMTTPHRRIVKDALGSVVNHVVVPIKSGNNIAGIIELYNARGVIGDDKKETLVSIGGHIGVSAELFKRLFVLEERTHALREISEITEVISSPNQLTMVIDVILNNAHKFFLADGCSLLLKDDAQNLVFYDVTGESAPVLKGKQLKKGEGVVGWVMKNNEPVLINDAEKDERFISDIDNLTKMNTGSVMCAPLRIVNEIIGVLEVIREKEKNFFNEEDLEMLSILASHASIAIDKARLFTYKQLWSKSVVELLCRVISIKDGLFPEHRKIVEKYVILLGQKLELNSAEIENLILAASIQDIGKLIIPEIILKKEGDLSEEEWNQIRKHPVISSEILETVNDFRVLVPVIKYHHERYDGTGYPEGLSGEEIPYLARILSIADAYSAMIANRPYREKLSKDEAKKVIIDERGRQFDPKLSDEFIKILESEEK